MAAHAGPDAVESGLVLHLDAANSKSYPGSGTSWNTLVSGSNCVLVNGPAFSTNQNGSFTFDGINDTAYVVDSTYAGTVPNVFTVETASKGAPTTAICRGTGGWAVLSDLLTIYTINDYPLPFTWDANTFYHTVSIVNGTSFTRYINNVVANNITISASRSTCTNNTLYFSVILNSNGSIRSYNPQSTLHFFKIYNRALSATEIKQNFNALRGRYGI